MMGYQDIQKNIIDWLILHRNLKGLTQVQLSKLLGRNQSFVSKYENCEQNLIITEFLEICVVLECDPTVKLQGEMDAIKIKRNN
jgi:transcriptional regulator with XRE-family HTH domain